MDVVFVMKLGLNDREPVCGAMGLVVQHDVEQDGGGQHHGWSVHWTTSNDVVPLSLVLAQHHERTLKLTYVHLRLEYLLVSLLELVRRLLELPSTLGASPGFGIVRHANAGRVVSIC